MARSIRLEFGGAFYHVMARGNRREAIFFDDVDRRFFLGCVAEACEKTGWLVHAWVLMGNHYHLLIETPEPNLVEGMKWLQNTYTRRFNVRHRDWGRLFGDRYKAVLVEGESPHYYGTLWDYIHLNPCRAGLVDVTQGGSVLDYPWSSLAGGYALPAHQRPKWLATERGLSFLGVVDDVAGRRALVERLDRRAAAECEQTGLVPVDAEADRRGSHLRRGWYWGGRAFAERVVKLGAAALGKKRRSRAYVGSRELGAHGEAEALQLLAECLEAAGLGRKDLAGRPCTDPCKVAMASMLWKKTTVSQSWIAQNLEMKNPANVSRVIHRMDGEKIAQNVPATLAEFVGLKMKENAH